MATEIFLTGTGYPTPVADRAGPGVLLRHGKLNLQFDAGRATSMRLAACGVACGDLDALFITHHHSDHMVGLPDVVMSRWISPHARRDEPLPIVVPLGEGARIAGRMLEVWQDELSNRAEHSGRQTRPQMEVRAFDAQPDSTAVWESTGVRVSSCLVHHEPLTPAVGYRIDTPDGSVAVSGDTRVCEELETMAAGVDVLVHEAMRREAWTKSSGGAARPVMDYHADTIELGAMAARTGARTLILTHLIPAPRGERDEAAFVEDVRTGGFAGEVLVGHDLMRYSIG